VTTREALEPSAVTLAQRLGALSSVTQRAIKESIRRVVMEHRFTDDDLVDEVYGSSAFKDAVAAFGSKAKTSNR
jgi:hypothetical protein